MRKFYYNCNKYQFKSKGKLKDGQSIFLNDDKKMMFKLRYAKRTIESYLKWSSSLHSFPSKKQALILMHDTES